MLLAVPLGQLARDVKRWQQCKSMTSAGAKHPLWAPTRPLHENAVAAPTSQPRDLIIIYPHLLSCWVICAAGMMKERRSYQLDPLQVSAADMLDT